MTYRSVFRNVYISALFATTALLAVSVSFDSAMPLWGKIIGFCATSILISLAVRALLVRVVVSSNSGEVKVHGLFAAHSFYPTRVVIDEFPGSVVTSYCPMLVLDGENYALTELARWGFLKNHVVLAVTEMNRALGASQAHEIND